MTIERSLLLIADEDAALRSALARYFQLQGHEVATASSAQEAIGLLGARRCDAVVDGLPFGAGGGGEELLQACRVHDPACPVLLLTIYGTTGQASDAMRQGAFGYLEKPFDAADLEVLVHRALEHGQLRREVARLQDELARRAPVAPAPPPSAAAPQVPPATGSLEDDLLALPEQGIALKALLERIEDHFLGLALARTGGNRNLAARLLGLKRTTLVEKLKRRGREAAGSC